MKSRRFNQFLSGGGEMGKLIREKDWSKTPVGDPETWPQSLRTTLSIIVNSRFPMFLFWGPELICFYNDAYRPSLGNEGKHPAILGGRAEDYWQEIWKDIKPIIDDILAGGQASWDEDRLLPIFRNGKMEDVYWTFSYSPVNDESGKPAAVFVTCNETTEKVITRKKLEENKNQLEFAIDAADLATWDLDPVTNKFTGNDRLMEWHGLHPAAAFDLEQGLNTVMEKDRELLRNAIEKSLDYSSGGLLDLDYTIVNSVTKQARIVRVKGKATFGEDKKAYRLNGTLQDVTQQVTAQKAIEESEKNLRLMITQAPAAMCVFKGKNHVVEIINNRMLELWNKQPGQVINKPIFEGLPEAKGQGLEQIVDHVFTTGERFEANERPVNLPRNNRIETIFINFVYEPLKDAAGNTYGILAIASDVTSQVIARKKIEESAEQLRIAVEGGELGTFDFYPETDTLIWSEKTKQLFGLPADAEVNYATYLQGLHPDDRGNSKAIAEQHSNLKEGGLYELEYRTIGITDGKLRWLRSKGKATYNEEGNPVRYTGVIYDITRQKEAEKALKDTEHRLRSLVDSAPFPIGVYTGREMRIAFVNDSILEAWGRKRDVVGKLYAEVLTELTGQGVYEQLDAVFTTGIPFHAKNQYLELLVDGKLQPYYYNYSFTPLHDAAGKIYGVLNTAANVTDLNVATKKTQESEKEFRQLADSLPALVWTTDSKGVQTFASKRWKEFTGLDPYDAATFEKMTHPQDLEGLLNNWKDCLATGKIYKADVRLKSKTGDYEWFYVNGEPVKNERGEIEKWIGTFTNVNEQKKVEEYLKKLLNKVEDSEKRFRSSVEQAPLAITILRGPDFIVEMANNTYLSLVDRPKSTFIGRPLFESLPEVKDIVLPLLKEVVVTGVPFYATEFPVNLNRYGIQEELSYFNLIYHPLKEEDGSISGVMVVATEVTGMVKAKESLTESEKQFRSLVTQSPIAMTIFRGEDFVIEMANKVLLEKIWRKEAADVIGKPLLQAFPELGQQKYPDLLKQVYQTGVIFTEKESAAFVEGEGGMKKFYLDYEYRPLQEANGIISGIMVTVNDVTETVEARKKVEENEERLRMATQMTKLGTWEYNPVTGYLNWSDECKEIYALPEGMEVNMKMFSEHIHPDDKEYVELAIQRSMDPTGDGKYDISYRILRFNDNSVRWIRANGKVYFNAAGVAERFIGTVVDISDQKLSQQILEESEQRSRLAIEAAQMGTFNWNLVTNNFISSPRLNDIFGYAGEPGITHQHLLDGFHPEDKPIRDKAVNEAAEKGSLSYEARIIWPNKSLHWVRVFGKLIFNEQQQPLKMYGTVIDITEEKINIIALEESTARLNIAIEAAELGTWELNTITHGITYSERYLEIFGFEKNATPTHEELLLKMHPDDMPLRNLAMEAAFENGLLDYEIRIFPKPNKIAWIKAKGKVFYDENKKPEKMLGTVMDVTEEKYFQQELLEREQKFRLLAESMPQFVWTGNADGVLNYFNQSIYDYSGLTPAQIEKEGWLQIVHPDEQEENIKRWMESVKTGQDFLFEHRFRRFDGEHRWQLSKAVAQRDINGNIQMWVGTSADIQDQKLWSEKIQKSELLFKTISNVSPVGLWMTDANAQNIFVNDTWIAWTGESFEKQLGTGWLNRVVEEDKKGATAKFLDCLQKREKYVAEFRITRADGELQWCLTEGSPYSDIHGSFAGYAGSVTDITDRKLIEKELEKKVAERTLELRKSEERYFRMINEVQDYAIILLNRKGIIENWNKGAERIKGYTAEEAVGRHSRLFYTKNDQDKELPEQLIEKAATAGRAVDEGWRVKKDGTIFWASVVITALHDSENNIIGFSKVTRDLTERKMAEIQVGKTNTELKNVNEALAKSNSELEQFAYVASHDLQEPLRKIRFFTERLEHSMINADATARDYYQKIQKASERMNTLIKDLLDFSRLSQGNEKFVKTDLNVVIENVRHDLELLIQQKKVVIEIAGLPVIEAIPLQMQQLFYNLLSNSLKFSRNDILPQINISACSLSKKEIVEHNLDANLSYQLITVKDNGIGFEQEYAEQIFVIFQRLNDLYSYGGTGIGLALCKKIVLNHHGKIYAVSEEGKGASFYIIFPEVQKIPAST